MPVEQDTAPSQDAPLTTGQVAELFNVHPVTVIKWTNAGKLPHFKTPGGQRRYWRAEVEAFMGSGVPAEDGDRPKAVGQ